MYVITHLMAHHQKKCGSHTTVFSLDAVVMYPSIKYQLIESAVRYFCYRVSDDAMDYVEQSPKTINFGMNSALITFVDKYYKYDSDKKPKERGLTIGGYESAWLADLVASYLIMVDEDLFNIAGCFGIFHDDDGLVTVNGSLTPDEIKVWLEDFQTWVDVLL
jgi:hypothetical protein